MAIAFVLVAGIWIVRSTIVDLSGGTSEAARSAWPSHPDVLSAGVMEQVGLAAARGQEPGPRTMAAVRQLAIEQPFSPFPFLVHGALAARRGEYPRAELLLLQARQRAPRAPAARFMLADLYLRTGRALPAMREMAVLNRLVPGMAGQLAPALAAYAATPGAVPELRSLLNRYPELTAGLMVALSADATNDRVLLQLADASGASSGDWQRVVLNAMIARGAYAEAYTLWTRFADVEPRRSSLFNPGFSPVGAPPPFNWELAKGSGGFAEPRSGSLEVLYYGREDLALASQLLLLQPGAYRLAMNVRVTEGVPSALRWTLTCAGTARPLMNLPLGPARLTGSFVVPEGCAAQRLELRAVADERNDRAGLTIGALQLTKLG